MIISALILLHMITKDIYKTIKVPRKNAKNNIKVCYVMLRCAMLVTWLNRTQKENECVNTAVRSQPNAIETLLFYQKHYYIIKL